MGRLHKTAYPKLANSLTPSEIELKGELDQARIVYRICDRSKRRVERVFDSGNSPRRKVSVRQSELGMIKQIEKLCPELCSNSFGDPEALDKREIGVHEAWTGKGRSRGCSQLSNGCLRKACWVKPPLGCLMNAGGATNLERPVVGSEVVFKVDARFVDTVNDENREPRGDLLDYRGLPASEGRVDRAAPVAADGLAFAEGQVIDDAGGELLIKVYLRQTPVRSRGTGQRPIGRAAGGTETVRITRVERMGPSVPEESVKTVPCALCLGFDLKRVIAS